MVFIKQYNYQRVAVGLRDAARGGNPKRKRSVATVSAIARF
jgi:hypothetical protein